MSGTGKSTVITDLQKLGYKAVDLDTDAYSVWVATEADPQYPDDEVKSGKDWVWHEESVRKLLVAAGKETLFVSGCSSNMYRFYPDFDHIVLLTAPDAVILNRLGSRTEHAYGSLPEEAERVLRLKQNIEPLLRETADLEIDTGVAGETAAVQILRHISERIK